MGTRKEKVNISHFQSVAERRKESLCELFEQLGFKTQTDFAEKAGISRGAMSNYMSGAKNISENVARKIEKNLGKPKSWMDRANLRIYILANVSVPSSEPDSDKRILSELEAINADFDETYSFRPISAIRKTLGEFDLILTLDLYDSENLSYLINKINGVFAIVRTTSLLVLEKNSINE